MVYPYDYRKIRLIQCLEDTRDLIEKGWTQGKFEKRPFPFMKTKYCLVGAVKESVKRNPGPGYQEVYDALDDQITYSFTSPLDRMWGGPIGWNDRPGRTKGEVIELINDAITRLGQK